VVRPVVSCGFQTDGVFIGVPCRYMYMWIGERGMPVETTSFHVCVWSQKHTLAAEPNYFILFYSGADASARQSTCVVNDDTEILLSLHVMRTTERQTTSTTTCCTSLVVVGRAAARRRC